MSGTGWAIPAGAGWEGDGHPREKAGRSCPGLWAGREGGTAAAWLASPCPGTWKCSEDLTALVCLCHSWVGYEKEGFRGHQYLLEEGQYQDWRQWGGYSKELVSLRLIRTVRAGVVASLGDRARVGRESQAPRSHPHPPRRAFPDCVRQLGMARCPQTHHTRRPRGAELLPLSVGSLAVESAWPTAPSPQQTEGLGVGYFSPQDFSDPALVLFEAMDFEEGASVELSEALPDTQLAGYGSVTQSIHVLSGV